MANIKFSGFTGGAIDGGLVTRFYQVVQRLAF